jgi:hypothetical protein
VVSPVPRRRSLSDDNWDPMGPSVAAAVTSVVAARRANWVPLFANRLLGGSSELSRAVESPGRSDEERAEGSEITKRYDESIEVSATDREWGPAGFIWRGRRYEVDRPLASWREAPHVNGRNSHADREFFRLLARPEGSLATGDLDADGYMQNVDSGAVYDVYLDPARGEWRLARVWD